MRIFLYFIVAAVVLTTSCASTHKGLKNSSKQTSGSNIPGTSLNRTLMPATPIKEVEEKLVSDNNKAPDIHKYFVIIGSFRKASNAKKHQALIGKDGFVSAILKNEAGFYRVSIKATDDANEARDEVRRIWAKFPKYSDTWMLVQIR